MRHCVCAISLLLFSSAGLSAETADSKTRLRRPVAMDVSPDNERLFVANRDSGSISVVNVGDRTLSEEINVGGQLVDIAVLGDSYLVAVDGLKHQLVLLQREERHWSAIQRLDVAQYPVRLVADADSGRCFVASLWSRTVTEVKFSKSIGNRSPHLETSHCTTLDFEPRELCLTADGQRLLVVGAFRNSLTVIDTTDFEAVSTKQLSGHNARGMALTNDGKGLVIAHQLLNPLGQSTQDDVHWGNMISNVLVRYSVDELIESESGVMSSRVVRYPGEPGNAAGDPGCVTIGPNGELAIALSGVSEIAISNNTNEYRPQRVTVGRRPVAMTRVSDGTLFVANMFSDSVSVVNPAMPNQLTQISLGSQPKLNPVQLGETLFYDSRLSHDGWMSCHSCHSDGHTNGLLNDNLSDGSFGEPKRVLSLLGVADTGPWAWSGQVKTLKELVRNSIEKTMQGTLPAESDVAALVAYIQSLPAPPKPHLSNTKVVTTRRQSGEVLFNYLNCRRCHTPPFYTSMDAYDVAIGNGKFNPPSLRGVGRRAALFHDARADSLTSVFTRHRHQLPLDLSSEEVEELVQFLKTL